MGIAGGVLVLLFAVVAIEALVDWRAGDGTLTEPLIFAGLFAYFVLYFAVYLPWWARRAFRTLKSAGTPFKGETSEEGITISSQYGGGITPWDHVIRWREGRKVFLLYVSTSLFYVLPKRLFASAADEAEFRDTLRRKTGHAA